MNQITKEQAIKLLEDTDRNNDGRGIGCPQRRGWSLPLAREAVETKGQRFYTETRGVPADRQLLIMRTQYGFTEWYVVKGM